jgi:hypothetical protein
MATKQEIQDNRDDVLKWARLYMFQHQLNSNDHNSNEELISSFWWVACIFVNTLNQSLVDRPTICQSIRMERSCCQDSKSKFHKKQRSTLFSKLMIFSQDNTLRNLLLHKIFSEFQEKKIFLK